MSEFIFFRPLGQTTKRVPMPPNCTLRELQLEIAAQMPGSLSEPNSFTWTMIVNGTLINTAANRDRPAREFLNSGDIVHGTLWTLGRDQRCKNNVANDEREKNSSLPTPMESD